ncbi:hypothetical protein RUI03_00580 [Parvularcula sp. LCG005]|nr:hypothetical protein [Parvularcula sp. LCG005]WOI53503.1 hypothetical protein RUI03_00580 [Parvularcula sp. LCG005]
MALRVLCITRSHSFKTAAESDHAAITAFVGIPATDGIGQSDQPEENHACNEKADEKECDEAEKEARADIHHPLAELHFSQAINTAQPCDARRGNDNKNQKNQYSKHYSIRLAIGRGDEGRDRPGHALGRLFRLRRHALQGEKALVRF